MNKIKYGIYVFISGLILSGIFTFASAQNFWYELNSPTPNFLRTLHFLDSLKGWVAGDSGLILYTSNGGDDWIEQETNSDVKIQDIFFLNEDMGWAVAWRELIPPVGTSILNTTNGGQSWEIRDYPEENVFLATILFLDSLNGWMGGYPGDMVRTNDGGISWREANIDSGTFAFFPPLNFDFYNDGYGFASGGVHDIAGVIWKTTNGGDSWAPMDPQYAPPDEIWDIHFFDSLNVMGIGGDPDLFGVGTIRSSDAGNSWDYVEIGLIGVARAISFRTETEGWAPVPDSEKLIYTLDSGETWTIISAPNNSMIYDLVMTDSLTGYGVGFGGIIIKYEYPIINSASDGKENSLTSFKLDQNFPNPFNPETKIKFSLSEDSNVKLTVYDIKGELVSVLTNEFFKVGEYEKLFNAENLHSGIYFYEFIAESNVRSGQFFQATKKMVFLK